MDRLDAIRVFVRVVESGSFSVVARELGVGQPTVSKQIAGLERYLGAQLLMRTSHAVRLTDAGRDFFESSSRLLEELQAVESRIGRGLQAPSGRVRVSVAPSFGALYLVPRLQEFFRRFPDVSIEVLATDRTTNLVEDGIDVAIRRPVRTAARICSPSLVMKWPSGRYEHAVRSASAPSRAPRSGHEGVKGRVVPRLRSPPAFDAVANAARRKRFG
jgi:DNA-binding transcriptional LysR family regulator